MNEFNVVSMVAYLFVALVFAGIIGFAIDEASRIVRRRARRREQTAAWREYETWLNGPLHRR